MASPRSRARGLGGTTGLQPPGRPGGPRPLQALRAFAGAFREGYRASRKERVIPPSRIAPSEAAEGTPSTTTAPLSLPPRGSGSSSARQTPSSHQVPPWGQGRMVLVGLGKACGISNPTEWNAACWGRKGQPSAVQKGKYKRSRVSLYPNSLPQKMLVE